MDWVCLRGSCLCISKRLVARCLQEPVIMCTNEVFCMRLQGVVGTGAIRGWPALPPEAVAGRLADFGSERFGVCGRLSFPCFGFYPRRSSLAHPCPRTLRDLAS